MHVAEFIVEDADVVSSEDYSPLMGLESDYCGGTIARHSGRLLPPMPRRLLCG